MRRVFVNNQLLNHPLKATSEKIKSATFEKDKEPKNTVKFSEVQTQGQAPIIGTLYLQKWVARDAAKLEVTVEPAHQF